MNIKEIIALHNKISEEIEIEGTKIDLLLNAIPVLRELKKIEIQYLSSKQQILAEGVKKDNNNGAAVLKNENLTYEDAIKLEDIEKYAFIDEEDYRKKLTDLENIDYQLSSRVNNYFSSATEEN